jgi:hypothetical protein
MGYNTSSINLNLTAKLTLLGRQKIITTNNGLITYFSLGDSDANYNVALPLLSGQVPTNSGNVGATSSSSNSVGSNTSIKSNLIVNSAGGIRKFVETQSSGITLTYVPLGLNTVTNNNLTQNVINRNNVNTDPLVNLYYSFNLSLNSTTDNNLTGVTSTYGGYSDTALSGLAVTNILAIAINNSQYGEMLDGKSIKAVLSTSAGTSYTIYSTFENINQSLATQDANYVDPSTDASLFGNVAFLVSDDIMKPNGGNPTLSWSTGFNTIKPFSVNGKSLLNRQTNTNLNLTADTIVGIAYLDKGILVITHPAIVNNFSTVTATTVSFGSVSTVVQQNITCLANRGEFGTSTNPTFTISDSPRITEVGLYDASNNLIAIAKTDRQLVKKINDFFALSINLTI